MQKEVIEKLAKKHELTIAQVEAIVSSQGEVVKESLKQGKTVKVARLGKFVKIDRIRGYREGTETKR